MTDEEFKLENIKRLLDALRCSPSDRKAIYDALSFLLLECLLKYDRTSTMD